ncbi:uncharacterized protein DEA37_0013104 [Paragonimus westermani]|uniref:Uncharacterized protein n=1 Tax=Paragonimus westermani TaxID=34504 RepID=A0A5J4NYP9_9TREM|nr:uncharacterized protein DEA37_0013104 [Paragonimus westermani]
MGNCLESMECSKKQQQKCCNQQNSNIKGSKSCGYANATENRITDYSNSTTCTGNLENAKHTEDIYEQTEERNAHGEKGNLPVQQKSGSNSVCYSTDEENDNQPGRNTQKEDPSWMKYLSQPKPNGDLNVDADVSIAFGENWDPDLFDQRGSPTHRASHRYGNDEPMNQRNYYDQIRTYGKQKVGCAWEHWPSVESINSQTPYKRQKLRVLSSSILGFSPIRNDLPDTMEWFRNGELESPQPNTKDYLIKAKQRPPGKHTGEHTEQNADLKTSTLSISPVRPETESYREGWLRYTMFMYQDKTDDNFYSQFRNAKHIFLSLEAKTGCELRVSKRLFVHRGKLVRMVVIDGPSRKHIIRCYTSLPKILTGLIILECERPSILEPRPNIKAPESEINFSGMLQRPLAV